MLEQGAIIKIIAIQLLKNAPTIKNKSNYKVRNSRNNLKFYCINTLDMISMLVLNIPLFKIFLFVSHTQFNLAFFIS